MTDEVVEIVTDPGIPIHPEDPSMVISVGHNSVLGVVMLRVFEKVLYMSPDQASAFGREVLRKAGAIVDERDKLDLGTVPRRIPKPRDGETMEACSTRETVELQLWAADLSRSARDAYAELCSVVADIESSGSASFRKERSRHLFLLRHKVRKFQELAAERYAEVRFNLGIG